MYSAIEDKFTLSAQKIEKLKESLLAYHHEVEKLRAKNKETHRPKKESSKDGQGRAMSDFKSWLNDQQLSKRNARDMNIKPSESKEASSSMRENKLTRLKPQSVEARSKPELLKGGVSTEDLMLQLNFRRRTTNKQSHCK